MYVVKYRQYARELEVGKVFKTKLRMVLYSLLLSGWIERKEEEEGGGKDDLASTWSNSERQVC